MDTQDIIKSLSNLEHSLQGVESAKQQVDKTIAAYGATQKQLATLSQEFVIVSKELGSVINIISNNQEQLSVTLSSKIEHLLIQIEDKVAVIGSKAALMNQAFESSYTEAAKSINKSIDAAISSFNGKIADEVNAVSSLLVEFDTMIKDIQEGFQTDASQAISTLQKNGEKVVTGFQEKIANHLNSLSKLNGELEAIINLQKKQNAEILTKFEAASSSIKVSIIDTVKDEVSSISSQLCTATNRIIDINKQVFMSEVADIKTENARIKKFVLFCLIVTIISVILNIIMIFH